MKALVSAFVLVSAVLVLGLVAGGYLVVALVVVGLASIAGAEIYARSKRPVPASAVK
jgi:hypothetical protein